MKMRVFARIVAIVSVFGVSAAQWACGQIEKAKVTGGEVQGVIRNGVAWFKGIPFAAPPVGELRWKAPQPVKPWTGVKQASRFGPGPMQEPFFAAMMGGSTNLSEDCLYLNVWTAAKSPDEKLPVMVWIYGGAFVSGMTDIAAYDGTKLAQRGVVLVSAAYRLGAFGFLAHPDLSQESGKGSGCYGLQDQVAALRWVKDNIEHFGGDPARVTIFGESAGGISVSMLTCVPAAKGLFHRAISQSGGSMAPVKHDGETAQYVPALKLAEETGRSFLAKLGANDLKTARGLPAGKIQKAVSGMGLFWPVADGETILGDQYELFEAGKFNDTPVLIGSNSDEGAMFVRNQTTPDAFEKQAREDFGRAAVTILAAYPHASESEAFKSNKDLFRDSVFGWPTWAWAKLQSSKGKNKAFLYYFDHRTAMSPDGASHATEIGYVFGNLGGWGGGTGPEDIKLSDLISSYWVNFAKTGDPNGAGLPSWPAFDEKEMRTMFFDKAPSNRPVPNLNKLKAWDEYYAWRREARN